MTTNLDEPPTECPECHSDEIHIESIRDRFNKDGKLVARTFWILCEDCGWCESFTKRLV